MRLASLQEGVLKVALGDVVGEVEDPDFSGGVPGGEDEL
jgi:hypothetical protein